MEVARSVFRILALLLVFQISGFAHRIADVVIHDRCAESCDHHSSRGNDDDGDECPPGCPSCHSCAHSQSPYVASNDVMIESPLAAVSPAPRSCVIAPPQRDLPNLFRPPRVV